MSEAQLGESSIRSTSLTPSRPVHPARSAGIHPIRQWTGVHCQIVRDWIAVVGAKTVYITPGSPWENGYVEIFDIRLRAELLNEEIFYNLKKARFVIEQCR